MNNLHRPPLRINSPQTPMLTSQAYPGPPQPELTPASTANCPASSTPSLPSATSPASLTSTTSPHGRDNWFDTPGFQTYFGYKLSRLAHLFKVFADTQDVEQVLGLIPKKFGILRNDLPSMQQCRGQKVQLCLGLCPRRENRSQFWSIKNGTHGADDRCFTQFLIWSLESDEQDGLTLHLSLRRLLTVVPAIVEQHEQKCDEEPFTVPKELAVTDLSHGLQNGINPSLPPPPACFNYWACGFRDFDQAVVDAHQLTCTAPSVELCTELEKKFAVRKHYEVAGGST
ncbi:uncharacterized protein PAC_14828 [Phialocephala subalpina]|uniref:Uncharacterized protein n=1 Tax=Phialocephala subalpina TaxID=576137 RepID=A0A1L7XIT6_9HELO|nr:uncharacterized protein PAC_14828 [Phialocephala subalpina]